MEICKICSKEATTETHFWNWHRITKKEYYLNYYNKKDLHTGQPIPWHDREQYLVSDFVDKENMRLYLGGLPKSQAAAYCRELLSRRKWIKKLVYTPSQVELRSTLCPGAHYLHAVFGDYYKLATELGLKNKYLNGIPEVRSLGRQIIFDTREQNPVQLRKPTLLQKLDYGDYALDDPDISGRVHVERKSLSDFIGSFGKQIGRLEAEIELAASENAYLVIMVEVRLDQAIAFNKIGHIAMRTHISPQYIFHNVRDLCQKYPNIQFLFVDGRKEMSRLIPIVLENGAALKNYDLELLYETKRL